MSKIRRAVEVSAGVVISVMAYNVAAPLLWYKHLR
jgi:hypothetical protein